jgi:ABC-type amino acid transport substrate-binding protein
MNKLFRWTALALSLAVSSGAMAQARDLDEIKEKGVIRVAMYNDYPPYSARGKGVDVDIAKALARRLNVRLDPLWFDADENVDDDLRNMVWKGHYLGHGPADLMIHAPVDPELARRNPQVRLLAPYNRERLAIARDTAKIPHADDMSFLESQLIGVEDASLASVVLLSYDGGKYRERVKHFKSPSLAVAALLRGEIGAVMLQQGEAEGLLNGKPDIAIALPPPMGPFAQRQWLIGLAVKTPHKALAEAVESAMAAMVNEGEMEKLFAGHGMKYMRP